MSEKELSAEQAVKILVESYMRVVTHAADIAYARRTIYQAYIAAGFTPIEALELCKLMY
jgi:hypothetical protein